MTFQPTNASLASQADLGEHVQGWPGELLLDLVTAQGQAVPEVVQRLWQRISDLKGAGVTAFRFGDLVDLLKRNVRGWESILTGTADDIATEYVGPDRLPVLIPVVRPGDPVSRRSFVELLRCVTRTINSLRRSKEQEDLWNLWLVVRDTAIVAVQREDEVRRLSNVKMSERLGISRHRLPQLYDRLGELVERCQASEADGGGGAADEDSGHPDEKPTVVRAFRRNR